MVQRVDSWRSWMALCGRKRHLGRNSSMREISSRSSVQPSWRVWAVPLMMSWNWWGLPSRGRARHVRGSSNTGDWIQFQIIKDKLSWSCHSIVGHLATSIWGDWMIPMRNQATSGQLGSRKRCPMGRANWTLPWKSPMPPGTTRASSSVLWRGSMTRPTSVLGWSKAVLMPSHSWSLSHVMVHNWMTWMSLIHWPWRRDRQPASGRAHSHPTPNSPLLSDPYLQSSRSSECIGIHSLLSHFNQPEDNRGHLHIGSQLQA